MPIEDETIDVAAQNCLFNIFHDEELELALREMYRVLKHGGTAVILEFSHPKRFPVKQLYNFYFQWILPLVGRLISKHDSAYTYLPQSVKDFPDGIDFINRFEKAGFQSVKCFPLSFGIASIYIGEK